MISSQVNIKFIRWQIIFVIIYWESGAIWISKEQPPSFKDLKENMYFPFLSLKFFFFFFFSEFNFKQFKSIISINKCHLPYTHQLQQEDYKYNTFNIDMSGNWYIMPTSGIMRSEVPDWPIIAVPLSKHSLSPTIVLLDNSIPLYNTMSILQTLFFHPLRKLRKHGSYPVHT